MYIVIIVSLTERVVYSGLDGYVALTISKLQREKTKFAVILQTPSGRRFSMAKQDIFMRRLNMES